jgi:hypothetical protein
MQRWNRSKCVVLALAASIAVTLLCKPPFLTEVVAASPSFGYEEIRDDAFNWIDMNHKQVRSVSEMPPIFGHPYTDILTVNYFSDGRTLNAILWLKYLFNKIVISNDGTRINYGMFIDADANRETGVGGIDYQVEISGQSGKWTRTFSQWSSLGTNRTLSEENYTNTNFFVKNGSYVLLHTDLNTMGSPDKYRVLFYAEQMKGPIWLIDATNWVHIPKPDYEISTSPSSIDLSQGDNKTVIVQIKSTTGFKPTVQLYLKSRDTADDMKLNFNPTKVLLPSYGVNTSRLSIYIPSNAELRTHIINVLANATFSPEPFLLPLSKSSHASTMGNLIIPSIEKSEVITKQTALNINVQTLWEKVLELLNKWQFPITFVSGIIIGNIAPWLFRKIRNRSKNRSDQKLDDYT